MNLYGRTARPRQLVGRRHLRPVGDCIDLDFDRLDTFSRYTCAPRWGFEALLIRVLAAAEEARS
jgi:hypothetical protein